MILSWLDARSLLGQKSDAKESPTWPARLALWDVALLQRPPSKVPKPNRGAKPFLLMESFVESFRAAEPANRLREALEAEHSDSHITAPAFATWLTTQGIEPSPHIAAWFNAQGVTEPAQEATDEESEPRRRLKRLRELGGEAKWSKRKQEWTFTRITKLEEAEKHDKRKRSDQKTIRLDLKEAANAEGDEKRASAVFGGL